MKKKIITVIIVCLIALAFVQNTLSFAAASGSIEITFQGFNLNGPIFDIQNMLPGDCVTRSIKVKNNTKDQVVLTVKSLNVNDSDNLSSQINFEIKEGSNTYYNSTLKNFFAQPSVNLGNISKYKELTYVFKACFLLSAGNEYQGTKVVFDLVFPTKHGHTPTHSDLPRECKSIKIEKIILGDEHNNKITGTNGSDYIDGKSGNDNIRGLGGDDCLVGGEGHDKTDGGQGHDKCLSAENKHSCE